MSDYALENVRTVVAIQNRDIRVNVVSMLRQTGYHKIEEIASFERAEETLAAKEVDLFIADAFMEEKSILDLVSRVRHDKLGNNPFFTTVLLSDSTTSEAIANIIDSGTDDILLKPINPKLLVDRIETLITHRKKFVVTTDYIGPNRRTETREGSMEIPIFDVPNALQFMAEGNTNRAQLQSDVVSSTIEVNAQKMQRQAYQIEFLAKIIEPIRLDDDKPNYDAVPYYGRLLYYARDLKERAQGTMMAHTDVLCDSLIDVTNKLIKNLDSPAEEDVRKLTKLAKETNQAFTKD